MTHLILTLSLLLLPLITCGSGSVWNQKSPIESDIISIEEVFLSQDTEDPKPETDLMCTFSKVKPKAKYSIHNTSLRAHRSPGQIQIKSSRALMREGKPVFLSGTQSSDRYIYAIRNLRS